MTGLMKESVDSGEPGILSDRLALHCEIYVEAHRRLSFEEADKSLGVDSEVWSLDRGEALLD